MLCDLTYRQTPNNITKAIANIYQKIDKLVILCIFCYNFPPGILTVQGSQ